jgi:ribonuclease HI
MLEDPEKIVAFTDGSCRIYPCGKADGGWAFNITFRETLEFRYGFKEKNTTVNQMELLAIHRCLEFVPASPKSTKELIIVTDSAYALNCCLHWPREWEKNGWRTSNGSTIANLKLIRSALKLIEEHRRYRTLRIMKVKGHAGVVRNEAADRQASAARKSKMTNWTPEDQVTFG